MYVVIPAIIGALIVIYLILSAILAFFVARPRTSSPHDTPASSGLEYEEITFNSRGDNLTLKGWYIPGGAKGTIIAVHGGKRNRTDASIKLLELCLDLAKKGFDILTYDRRGCGRSDVPGLRKRACLERDVGGAVDYIRSRKSRTGEIFLWGTSVGAATALVFAEKEDSVNGIVSDSCFPDAIEMATRAILKVNRFLLLFIPGARLMGKLIYNFSPVNALDAVGAVKCPVLFIHSAQDDGIPVADADRLFRASNNELNELWVVPGAGHSRAYMHSPEQYIDRVTDFFLNKCTLNQTRP